MGLFAFSLIITILIATAMIGISMVAFRIAFSSLVKVNQLEETLIEIKARVDKNSRNKK